MSVSFVDAESRMVAARAKLARRTEPLTIAEAVAVLGISRRTLFAYREQGLIDWRAEHSNPYVPPSACIDPAALQRLIEPKAA